MIWKMKFSQRTLSIGVCFILTCYIISVRRRKTNDGIRFSCPSKGSLPFLPHNYDFTELFWDKNSTNSSSKLNTILDRVNLWRPTDEFTGNCNMSYDDRILAQLILTENLELTHEKVIGLPDGYSYWSFTQDLISEQCPHLAKYCKFVDMDAWLKSLESNSSAQEQRLDGIVFGRKAYKTKVNHSTRAVYILESSMNARAKLERRDLLISYWRGSDIVIPYGKWVYHDPNVKSKEQNRNFAAGKTKMAAIFVSNCATANNRLGFVKELKNAGLEVDIYGGCGSLKCPKNTAESCFEKLKDYKFYLAFENSNCRDYITEKFFVNALANDIVPIVMGAHPDDYRNAAPLNSYIHIDEFPNTPAIVAYLNHLTIHDEDYNKYFQWKGTGQFINHKFFCRFCAMLHYGDVVPNPVRSEVLNWESGKHAHDPQSHRPCLPKGQFHWTLP